MSYVYVTKEKYNKYVEMLEELELLNEMKDKMKTIFQESLEYDPEKSTYSAEKYKQTRESNLKKSDGKSAYSESHIKATHNYNERHREERNRKERERYQRKKQEKLLEKESSHVKITTFV